MALTSRSSGRRRGEESGSKRVIEYIREHNVTTIRWKARARFKIVEPRNEA